MSIVNPWIAIAVGSGMELLNFVFALLLNTKDNGRLGTAIPVIPIIITSYGYLNLEVSVALKTVLILSAVALEATSLFIFPVIYSGWFNGRTRLHRAVIKGDLHAVEALLDEGFDVNARDAMNWSPVELATIKGYAEIVDLLASRGAEPGKWRGSV